MTTPKGGAKPPEVKVVFDTSALYTGSASDLLSNAAARLIRENSSHKDLRVTWYLPAVVRHERQYQMESAALALLPAIEKLERLLGHNLAITDRVMRKSVNDTIDAQISDLGLQLVELRGGEVDWQRVALDAAYRRAPFQPGEHEKGFRDLLIAETFLQILQDAPATPRICRVALVAGDGLLQTALIERTRDRKNARVLDGLDALQGLINTLVADVKEEFVAKIRDSATAYFFEKGNTDSVFYKEKLRDQLTLKFAKQLGGVPEGALRGEQGVWYIGPPRFAWKKGQRIHWVTAITVEGKAFATTLPPNIWWGSSLMNVLGSMQVDTTVANLQHLYGASGSFPALTVGSALTNVGKGPESSPPKSEQVIAKGKSVIEVSWSILVSTAGKIRGTKIEGSEFIGTTWEPVP